MNKLLYCTFTGVDEKTNLDELQRLSLKYPFIEWGFLVSTSNDANRYPSLDWYEQNLDKIKHFKSYGLNLAMHVCGKEVGMLINGEDCLAKKLLPYFKRIQINFISKRYDLEKLEKLILSNPDKFFITQQNNANLDLWESIKAPNHQLLFDASGGRGIETTEWIEPLTHKKKFGYAGGLGGDNITEQLAKISSVATNDYWIDMEGKLRVDDYLSIEKCEEVAKKVSDVLSNKSKFKI